MSELEKHIEKKIPFVIETKEGEQIVVFPAEQRFINGQFNTVMKDEENFNKELQSITADYKTFNSLRPAKP